MMRMVVRWDGEGCDEGGGEVCRLWCGEDGRNLAGSGGSRVSVDMAYPRHRYAVSSLMDTAYWLSEQ
ncbi:hypothetical protein Tco_0411507 [Tanacetum coccineum]